MRQVAPKSERAYSGAMPRLLRFLTMLALVLMPLGMMPGHAMAAVATVHCADMAPSSHPAPIHSGRSADCAIACSAMPSAATILNPPARDRAVLHPLPLATGHGLASEAAIPPPRSG